MPKMMPKFDAENVPEKCDFRSHFDSLGGRREVRRASHRRRRLRHTGFFYLKRLTPAGVGGFSGPWEIADRSKIVLLSIDGHFDPRKMPSGRGFGKNIEIAWKIDAKIEAF